MRGDKWTCELLPLQTNVWILIFLDPIKNRANRRVEKENFNLDIDTLARNTFTNIWHFLESVFMKSKKYEWLLTAFELEGRCKSMFSDNFVDSTPTESELLSDLIPKLECHSISRISYYTGFHLCYIVFISTSTKLVTYWIVKEQHMARNRS